LGAFGALIGGLAREGRTASLVALLVVLPIVFLGLVPKEVVPAAGGGSGALPLSPPAPLSPAGALPSPPRAARGGGGPVGGLVGLGLGYGLLARTAARRLLA